MTTTMALPPITLVAETPPHLRGGGFLLREILLFVDALAERSGRQIPIIYGPLREALPLDGFILLDPANHPVLTLDEQAPDLRVALSAWIVPIGINDAGHRAYSKVLEPLSLPAAIDGLSLTDWRGSSRGVQVGARGLYGLQSIAPLIGAECEDAFSRSERYCYLTSRVHFGLPHLLLDYLSVLANMRVT